MGSFSPFSYGGDFMFTAMPVIFFIGFFSILGLILYSLVRDGAKWHKNNNSPVLTVNAKVVAKRTDVSRRMHNHNDNMHHSSAYTTYYTTFEVESGDRMEFNVPDSEYGMLVEGDTGKLTFQGTRYHGFERMRGGDKNASI